MTRIALIFAAAAVAIPAAASAEPKTGPNATPIAVVAPAHVTRYCVIDEATTGTRLERRTCKSLDAWLADGYDPRVPAKK